jgi:ribonuclease HI
MPSKKTKFYAVMRGRKTGLFTRWDDCKRQVEGFQGAIYKSYPSKAEAEAAIAAYQQAGTLPFDRAAKPAKSTSSALASAAADIIWNSLSVDAACSGNPGDMEYRGVWTATGEEAFRQGPFPEGTNNLGEFLAIAHGLSLLQTLGTETPSYQTMPIYTDSRTAISWVRRRAVKTTLKQTTRNTEIFARVERALAWLQVHDYHNPILKWETERWGEIPADFGRK